MTSETLTPNPFEQYALPEPLRRALVAMNFKEPTPIQEQAIPIGLAGDDLIGCAQTGTGKTAAFLIPTLAKMIVNPDTQTLILVPTRELADQVFQVIKALTQFLPHVRTVLLMGGVPISKQFRLLRAPYRFVVATPGRLNDHLKRGSIELDFVRHLVIDEADRLLDMGFAPQLAQILNFLPNDRQSFMFTATLGDTVRKLSAKYLKNPKTIRLANTNEFKKSIEQRNVSVAKTSDKPKALLEEIRKCESSVLVFTRTQINTDRVARFLQDAGVNATQIHGGRTQGQRTWALRGFKNGEYRVMVATDIASRGIDVDHVGLVVNYEMPEDPDDYVHRIGRTGRADKEGVAVNLLTREDESMWKRISRGASAVRSKSGPEKPKGYNPGSSGDRTREARKTEAAANRDRPARGRFPSPDSRRKGSSPSSARPATATRPTRPSFHSERGDSRKGESSTPDKSAPRKVSVGRIAPWDYKARDAAKSQARECAKAENRKASQPSNDGLDFSRGPARIKGDRPSSHVSAGPRSGGEFTPRTVSSGRPLGEKRRFPGGKTR